MTYEKATEIYYINTEIKALQLELAQHEENRRYYKTVILSDMPKGKGKHVNPTDEYLIKEQELKDMIRYALNTLQNKLLKFEQFLSEIEDTETRLILRLRCVNNMSWQEIGDNIGMDRTTASRKFYRFFGMDK